VVLRLVRPRDASGEAEVARSALWTTLRYTAIAARRYTEFLLECRGEDVYERHGPREDRGETLVPASVWRARLLARLQHHGLSVTGELDAARNVLQELWKHLVDEQDIDGRAVHSALCDAGSSAGEARDARAQLLESLRASIMRTDDAAAADVSAVLRGKESVVRGTGARPRWVTDWLTNERHATPQTLDLMRRALAKNDRNSVPLELRIRGAGLGGIVVPLAADPQWSVESNGRLNEFERGAFDVAVEGLRSWNTWNARAGKERERRLQRAAKERLALTASELALEKDIIAWLQAERHRREAFERGLGTELRPLLLSRAQVRGWPELREKLDRPDAPWGPERIGVVRAAQARLGRRFGDGALFEWIVAPERRDQVFGFPADPVSRIARVHGFDWLATKARGHAALSYPDAVQSPRRAGFNPKGTSAPPYSLHADGSALSLSVELLERGKDGVLRPRSFAFALAHSRQLQGLTLDAAGDEVRLNVAAQDGLDRVTWSLGDGAIRADRKALSRVLRRAGYDALRAADLVEREPVGAFLKLALQRSVPDRSEIATFVVASGLRRAKHTPVAPIRVLSVDLGLRSAACVSWLQLGPAADRTGIAMNSIGWSITHLRSMPLRLEGDKPDDAALASRMTLDAGLTEVERLQSRLALLRRLCIIEEFGNRDWARMAEDEALCRVAQEVGLLPETCSTEAIEAFRRRVPELWRDQDSQLSLRLAELRRVRTMPRGTGGRSAWKIRHLDRLLRLIRRWRRRTTPTSENLRRASVAREGVVGGRLLAHLDALKTDRARSTADLIVQAARGRLYDQERGAWGVNPGLSCDVIVFEDLQSYRMRRDLPPSENRQLAMWMHRKVATLLEMQASEAGIATATVAAAWTSRFHAGSRAPGCRATRLTRRLLDAASRESRHWLRRYLESDDALAAARPGQLVVDGRGEVFLWLDRGGNVRETHADINAAQNLAHSALDERPEWVTMIRCRPRPDGNLDVELGKRDTGRLGWQRPLAVRQGDTDQWFQIEPRGDQAAAVLDPDVVDALDEIAALEQEADEAEGKTLRLFRDPTGVIAHGKWVEGKRFFGETERRIVATLRAAGKTIQRSG
jgi:hypothetical protein